MVKIWKYQVPGTCEGPIRQILKAKMQYGKPVVWVLLDDDIKEIRTLKFYTVGTGWELSNDDAELLKKSIYIDTVKDDEGYIWHVFCAQTDFKDNSENKIKEQED